LFHFSPGLLCSTRSQYDLEFIVVDHPIDTVEIFDIFYINLAVIFSHHPHTCHAIVYACYILFAAQQIEQLCIQNLIHTIYPLSVVNIFLICDCSDSSDSASVLSTSSMIISTAVFTCLPDPLKASAAVPSSVSVISRIILIARLSSFRLLGLTSTM